MGLGVRREDRNKSARLENILSRHTASEKRALADLRVAGYKFTTIEQAYHRLKINRSLRGFTEQQIDMAMELADRTARRRSN